MEQRNLILAGLLSVVVLLAWSMLFPAPERPVPVEAPQAPQAMPEPVTAPSPTPGVTPESDATAEPEAAAPAQTESVAAVAEEIVEIEVPGALVRITNRGGQILSYRLLETRERTGEPLEMVRLRAEGSPYPFALVGPEGAPLPINQALFVVERDDDGNRVRFRYAGAEGSVFKEFHFGEQGLFDVVIEATGVGPWGAMLGPGLRNPSAKELESAYQVRAAAHGTANEPAQILSRRLRERQHIPAAGIPWFGLEDTYFLKVLAPSEPLAEAVLSPVLLVPEGEDQPARFVPRPSEEQITDAQEDMVQEIELALVPAGDRLAGTSYWGPKSYRTLSELPLGLGLEKTVHFGLKIPVLGVILDPVVSFLSRGMLFLLLWIYDHVIANLGWSIVLLTVFIKLLLLPLTHKSYVSMQKMQKLQPKIEAIKQKHRGKQRDKQGRPNMEAQRKMNEEMQELFRSEGVNPAGGCLPLLMQMPVFFAFFSLLRNSVELWNAPFGLWIHDLSAPDPIYVLPVVMGLAQFAQQRITPMANTNPGQRILMNTMPIWFTFISFGFASGLVLYWLTNNLLTIVQQGTYQQLKKAGYFGGEPSPAPVNKPAKKNKERAGREKRKQ